MRCLCTSSYLVVVLTRCVLHFALQGYIPGWVVKKVTAQQPMLVRTIGNVR